jgi:leucyl aminopeptidase
VVLPEVRLIGGGLGDVPGADALAVPIWLADETAQVERETVAVGRDLGIDVQTLLVRERVKSEPGEVFSVPVTRSQSEVAQLLLVGVGDRSAQAYRRAGAAVARRVKTRAHLATTVVETANAEAVRAFVDGLLLGSYAFSLRTAGDSPTAVKRVSLVVRRPEATRPALERSLVTAKAVWLARDLANTPSLTKTPAWLAAQARRVARETGLEARVWDERQLATAGFGGILGVGSGSARPPRLIQLSYAPTGGRERRTRHVVLVGKGITFDSGGLSLKPREAMAPMKADMAGGAAVIAVMGALRDLGVAAWVTGLVAAAENLPSGSAMRPGDVLRHYGGRTVEVLNTDAEGRLVLADALAYADRELDPDIVVDIATLTGAASLALSRRVAALFATDDRLAAALESAGEASGDRLWRMPLVEDYRRALDSPVADLANVPRDRKVQGGAITAALFLREFAGSRPWAHLDIAGPGKVDADEHEVTKGGTGFGVRVLLRWLESLRLTRGGLGRLFRA